MMIDDRIGGESINTNKCS